MIIRILALTVAFCAIFSPSVAQSVPPVPARIGGTLTLVTTVQIVHDVEVGARSAQLKSADEYTFVVTRPDNTPYAPAAEDADGLNAYDSYIIDIPIYHYHEQPEGAIPGDNAVVHVYRNGQELNVISPPSGRIIVGNSGSSTPVDLIVKTTEDDEMLYTAPQLNDAVQSAIEKFDMLGDGIVGLPEAINALMVVAGIRTN